MLQMVTGPNGPIVVFHVEEAWCPGPSPARTLSLETLLTHARRPKPTATASPVQQVGGVEPSHMESMTSCTDPPWTDPKYVEWGEWSKCDADCGGGQRSRTGVSNQGQDVQQVINCQSQSCDPLDPCELMRSQVASPQETLSKSFFSDEGCGIANLVFVLDSSQSVGELNWYVVKQFVIDIITKLTIGPDATHVGIVIYASDVHAVIPLDLHMDAATLTGKIDSAPLFWQASATFGITYLSEKIWGLPYLAGATNTGEAIRAMRSMMSAGRRPDAKDIAFVLSDGQTNIVPDIVQKEAQLAKDEGVTIFSIGQCPFHSDLTSFN